MRRDQGIGCGEHRGGRVLRPEDPRCRPRPIDQQEQLVREFARGPQLGRRR
jgi:hypothetical protein